MMKIYLRKVFPHDVTHEVSVTTEIVADYFEGQHPMSFEGIKSGYKGIVTINSATDPRFGGEFKNILVQEGTIDENDLIVIYKKNKDNYTLEVLKPQDKRYSTFFSLFQNKERHVVFNLDDREDKDENHDSSIKFGAENVLLYGVPGAGKSHTIKTQFCAERKYMERVVFHPDYTYSDFVGQILPRVDTTGKLEYVFVPGPFTKILKKAYEDSSNFYYLVIEELNRGNAPAIFGEIFQLLDRYDEDNAPTENLMGESEYGITNYDVAKEVFGDSEQEVKIPANLYVLATMNTADQNVFTLDTAFQRRWNMRQIENRFDKSEHSQNIITGTNVNWGAFATVINDMIIETNVDMASSEDKRLGTYFAKKKELEADRFPEKVLKYLWDDAFKMDKTAVFNENCKSLEELVVTYENAKTDKLKAVLRLSVYEKMISKMQQNNAETNEN